MYIYVCVRVCSLHKQDWAAHERLFVQYTLLAHSKYVKLLGHNSSLPWYIRALVSRGNEFKTSHHTIFQLSIILFRTGLDARGER